MPRFRISIRDSPWWMEHLAKRHRPSWWPENEDWPPRDRRQWREVRKHNPFFRRLGCLFVTFNLLGVFFVLLAAALALNAFGLAHYFLEWRSLAPVGGLLFAFLIAMLVLAGATLRRVSLPLDDLLAASSRVAEGDYAARVVERGPTEVRSLAQAFNLMASKLQNQDAQRRAMLADVTHELRTPLTIIQGNLEGVLDGVYPPDQTRIRALLLETKMLSRLTDDLRTLAMAETGSLQLKLEPTDVLRLVRETVAAFESQAMDAAAAVDFEAAEPELLLSLDPERIRQVLTNLISNALHFAPRGSRVEVKAAKMDSSPGSRVVVSVTDHGPGIAVSDLPHVFDRYYKAADSRGMGLGLHIAKYIVEGHGGEIRAEGALGGGTTIWFSLPC